MNTIFRLGQFLLLFLAAPPAGGQLSVSPVCLYINDETNIGSLYLRNGNDMAREVEIALVFGYPGSDNSGRTVMEYGDTLLARRYGFRDRLRIFPRRFMLVPGGQQTVRLQVLPMNDRPEGMYWTRLVVKSGRRASDIEKQRIAGGISAKINYVFHQNLPVFYGKGALHTSLRIAGVKKQFSKKKFIARVHLKKSGNAPWNGTVTARLLDRKDAVLAQNQHPLVAFFDRVCRIELELPAKFQQTGSYRLELLFETKRNDISSQNLVQTAPLRHTVTIRPE